ncbi:MAG: hypothetical protein SFU83_07965 [Meiothermus sp.]|nr:hypothetical protein [Meiothermus sp.]
MNFIIESLTALLTELRFWLGIGLSVAAWWLLSVAISRARLDPSKPHDSVLRAMTVSLGVVFLVWTVVGVLQWQPDWIKVATFAIAVLLVIAASNFLFRQLR